MMAGPEGTLNEVWAGVLVLAGSLQAERVCLIWGIACGTNFIPSLLVMSQDNCTYTARRTMKKHTQ